MAGDDTVRVALVDGGVALAVASKHDQGGAGGGHQNLVLPHAHRLHPAGQGNVARDLFRAGQLANVETFQFRQRPVPNDDDAVPPTTDDAFPGHGPDGGDGAHVALLEGVGGSWGELERRERELERESRERESRERE